MRNAWIWGISDAGKLIYRYLCDEGDWRIKGIIDNSVGYRDFSYRNAKITRYDDIKDIIEDDDLIVICTRKHVYESIGKQLSDAGKTNYKWVYDVIDYEKYTNRLIEPEVSGSGCLSKICDSEDFKIEQFSYYWDILGDVPRANANQIKYHRKVWEWCYISYILEKEGFLTKGKKGIGFAVGKEPLPSLFAKKHAQVLATDLAADTGSAKDWSVNNQNAGSNVMNLFYKDICDEDQFRRSVTYRDVDMTSIPDELRKEAFDFCWSSCAIEHVGSLEKSKSFLLDMTRCIKPGGIAIHTTEFNLTSNEETLEYGGNVIWRRRDIEEMEEKLKKAGCKMDVSYYRSKTRANAFIDMPPYEAEKEPYHMNLVLDSFVSTSIALVIQKE